MDVEESEARGEDEGGEHAGKRIEPPPGPDQKDHDGQRGRDDRCQAQRDQADAECLERQCQQPDVQRRLGVGIVQCPVKGRRNPVMVADHFRADVV
jgi:hypothetical protein